ncbi:hypothetical protein [Paraburkholderia sp. BCC1885]|uniref:hypothetical protein n=1 Tax=Paraburkholderia sp. BCC1885 TaxID=2562669 RepID=UPI0016436019|nr:hypothetical protein [Paraburkholderia sp. BCC1885]
MSQDLVGAESRERSLTSAQVRTKTLPPSDGLTISPRITASRRRKPAKRRTNPVCPPIRSLMRYQDRIVRVVAEARGQRVIIESIDDTGRLHKSPVKWTSLEPCGEQLF